MKTQDRLDIVNPFSLDFKSKDIEKESALLNDMMPSFLSNFENTFNRQPVAAVLTTHKDTKVDEEDLFLKGDFARLDNPTIHFENNPTSYQYINEIEGAILKDDCGGGDTLDDMKTEMEQILLSLDILTPHHLKIDQTLLTDDFFICEDQNKTFLNKQYSSEEVDIKKISLTKEEEKIIQDFVDKKHVKNSHMSYEIKDESRQIKAQKSPHLMPVFPFSKTDLNSVEEVFHRSENFIDENLKQQKSDIENILRIKNNLNNVQEIFFKESIAQTVKENTYFETSVLEKKNDSSLFIQDIHKEFLKFKNSVSKQLTIHIKDNERHLTIVFKMNDIKGFDVTFRTKDKDWKRLLEKNKNQIQESLHDDDATIQIRYLGD
ncbi:MAG: hypothetical protein KBD31_04590 [Proteobacteria bacterium]|nr:hypothetical protein [Pseudomonadota bacterium]